MTFKQPIFIVKADGNRVPFDSGKLRNSLMHAGAKGDVANSIITKIESKLYNGITTKEIYRQAFALLRKEETPVAAHYSMKRAVLGLGPSGFPFERFVAEIFKRKKFTTSVGVSVRGLCARHEVDVTATRGGTCIGAELKFHNQPGTKSDIKDVLYVRARFNDVIAWQEKNLGQSDPCITEGWFVTNTKLTKHAIHYGRCAGLHMVSWSYPKDGSLEDLINETGVQPVTCLSSLSAGDKRRLMESGTVLCQSIHEDPRALKLLGVSAQKRAAALSEARAVCGK